MLWFKRFMAKHGMFFIGVYLLSFFLLVTVNSKIKVDPFFGDIAFKIGAFRVYLPFVSALACAVFLVTIYSVYRFLKE